MNFSENTKCPVLWFWVSRYMVQLWTFIISGWFEYHSKNELSQQRRAETETRLFLINSQTCNHSVSGMKWNRKRICVLDRKDGAEKSASLCDSGFVCVYAEQSKSTLACKYLLQRQLYLFLTFLLKWLSADAGCIAKQDKNSNLMVLFCRGNQISEEGNFVSSITLCRSKNSVARLPLCGELEC